MPWLDITFYFGLDPEIYYVPVKIGQVGPPYGNAYGYYKKYRPGKEWKKIFLTDHEQRSLLRCFLSIPRFFGRYIRVYQRAAMSVSPLPVHPECLRCL